MRDDVRPASVIADGNFVCPSPLSLVLLFDPIPDSELLFKLVDFVSGAFDPSNIFVSGVRVLRKIPVAFCN